MTIEGTNRLLRPNNPDAGGGSSASSAPPKTASLLDVSKLDRFLLQLLLLPFLQHQSKNILLEEWMALPLLQAITIWYSNGQTPAVRWLGLQFQQKTTNKDTTTRKHQHRQRLVLYIVLRLLSPILYHILQKRRDFCRQELDRYSHRQQQQQQQPPSNTTDTTTIGTTSAACRIVALERQWTILDRILSVLDDRGAVWPLIQLLALLSCWSGRTNTPDPAMILTGYTYSTATAGSSSSTNATKPPTTISSSSPQQQLHVDYAHRRWLFEQALITLQLYLSGWSSFRPVIWSPMWHSIVVRWKRILHRTTPSSSSWISSYWMGRRRSYDGCATNHNSQCPICFRNLQSLSSATTTTTAQAHPCGHAYCYTCLWRYQHQSNNTNTTHRPPPLPCVLCGTSITRAMILSSSEMKIDTDSHTHKRGVAT